MKILGYSFDFYVFSVLLLWFDEEFFQKMLLLFCGIQEFFGEIGEMKRYVIYYDQNGCLNVSCNKFFIFVFFLFVLVYLFFIDVLCVIQGLVEVVYMRRSDVF